LQVIEAGLAEPGRAPTEPGAATVRIGAVPPGTTTLRGTLRIPSGAFAHRPLELCANGKRGTQGDTPCERAAWRILTRTDSAGRYEVRDLPDGNVGFTSLEVPYHTQLHNVRIDRGRVFIGRQSFERVDNELREPEPSKVATVEGTSTVLGQLVTHEVPLAYVALELCVAHRRPAWDPTPCWNQPSRRLARTDADGRFVFERAVAGDLQIVMLELPYYPRMVFALGVRPGETLELGTKRVKQWAEHDLESDDESGDQWPDIRR